MGLNAARLQLLGPVAVTDAAGQPVALGGRHALAVLTVLALETPRAVGRDRLVDMLWGQDPPRTVVNGLQVNVSAIRKALGAEAVITAGRGYALGEGVAVDAAEFEQALVRAAALRATDPGAARAELVAALAGWRGSALAGLEGFPFALPAAARLEEQRLLALEQRLGLDLELGGHREAVSELESLVRQFPERESLWALWVRALGLSGRQADALAAYRHAREHLLDELGVEPGPELREAQMAVLRQEAPHPLLAGGFVQRMTSRARVPLPPDDTLGRHEDIDAVVQMVTPPGRGRLVTITGPGGVGKTRLALEVALRVQDRFGDGAMFVSLAAAQQPQDVLPTICTALGFGAGTDPAASLRAALAGLEILLVCDNTEHVSAAAADLADLLTAHPDVRLLITGRTPLDVPGERCYPLQPLAVEPLDGEAAPAVRLFLDRVAASDPRLLRDAGEVNLDLVAGICRHCDGLPLALEFAAARAPLLGLPALHAELDQTATRLAAHTRGLPGRHASLQANLEWSLAILDPTARRLLRTLFVFDGGFTAEAAAAVADLGHLACLTVVDTLLRHSLISRATSPTGTPRFTLLQTTRDYLTDTTDPDIARLLKDRHARYFNSLIDPDPVSMSYPATPADWWRLMPERPNLRAAIRWALHTHQHQLAADLVASTFALWERLGPKPEHREWLTLLKDAEGVTDLRKADLLIRLGARETNPSSACRLARNAIRILEHADDVHRLTVARALHLWKRELERPGTPENLHAAIELLAVSKTISDVDVRRIVLSPVAWVLIDGRHNPDRGRDCLRQAYELAASIGSTFASVGALNNLAEAALVAGDATEARDFAERGLKLIANELTQPTGVPFEFDSYFDLVGQLGCAQVHLGNSAEGIASLTTALDGHLRISDEYFAAEDLLRLAWAIAPADAANAAWLHATQEAIRHRLGWPLELHLASIQDQLLTTIRDQGALLQQVREVAAGVLHDDAITVMRHAAQEAGILPATGPSRTARSASGS